MKKYFIIFACLFVCGIAHSQVKKSPNRTVNSTSAKQTAQTEAEEKAKAEYAAKVKAEYERASQNGKCYFSFKTGVFNSCQNTNDFVVYEIPNMSSSQLKEAVYTVLTSMYKSPKDVIKSLSDNMIQLDGYAKDIYYFHVGSSIYFNDIEFNIVIQFKDGKVRYNKPTIKQLYIGGPLGKGRADMSIRIPNLIKRNEDREKVEYFFKELIRNINTKISVSNDW